MKHEQVVKLSLSATEILNTPLLNKGTGFTQEERDALNLNGLLPSHISSLEEQITRAHHNFLKKRTPLGKYDFLINLLGINELLFYQFVSRYPSEMLPFIYTPTVGEAAINYSSMYFKQRGIYISYPLRDKMDDIFANWPHDRIDVVVATDGERILGLGDQGIGGMTIPVGKLSLYTLFAGIHPAHTLPIFLDVGTNNPDLLNDPLYLGWRHKRLDGPEYDEFIDRFVNALHKRYPNVLLQWEDFGRNNARRILDHYREKVLSFNDDIQGTAAVTLAALFSALKESYQKLASQKIVILGGGSAGCGIADMIVKAMMEEGISHEEACRRIYIIDIDGLIHFNSSNVFEAQKNYVQPQSVLKDWEIINSQCISLQDVVVNVHPTVLIGVSAQGGAFTKEIVEEMAKHVDRPIIFPLSNPTSKAECTPQEIFEWTRGKAIVATGSPFEPVQYEGKTYKIGQCNNIYIFPGMGLGALASKATQVTDGMFLAATLKLSSFSPALKDPTASLFPMIEDVRRVSREIAIAVAHKACEENVSKISPFEIEKRVDELMWEPHYPRYVRSPV